MSSMTSGEQYAVDMCLFVAFARRAAPKHYGFGVRKNRGHEKTLGTGANQTPSFSRRYYRPIAALHKTGLAIRFALPPMRGGESPCQRQSSRIIWSLFRCFFLHCPP